MRQRTWRHRKDSGSYLTVLLAGSGLLCAVAPLPVLGADEAAPPFPQAEIPLRLAQGLAPNGPQRPPRWSTRYDAPLGLQPSRDINMPGAAGIGRPPPPGAAAPVPGPGQAPVLAPEIEDGEMPAERREAAKPAVDFSQPAVEAEEEGGISGWVIPPIRWLGNVGYTLRQNSNSGGQKNIDHLLTTNIRASSYIYAPWFATVSGDFGVVTGINRSSGSDGFAQEQQNRQSSFVGSGNLDLFPVSRFPFNANFSRSDSRVSGSSFNSDYTHTRLGLRQSYRSEDGQKSVTGNFDHSTVAMSDGRSDTVNALSGSLSAPLGLFNNVLTGRYSVSERKGSNEGSNLLSLNSTHTYRSENNFSLQAFSNYTDNTLRFSNGTRTSESRGQFLQLNTSATWQPEFEDTDDLPLTLTGGLLYFTSRSGSDSFSSDSQRISGQLSAYYRYSPNLSFNGSGTLNHIASNGGKAQLVTLLAGGVAYAGDPLMFGNFSYNWNTGANLSWQSGGGDTESSMFSSAQAGHSLGRNYIISPTDSVSLNLTQNLTAYQTQTFGNSQTLTHSAMASYRLGLGDQFSGSATATLSDVLTTGASAQHYRNLNLGLNGFGQLSPRSSASINLSFNWSDQTIKNTFDSFGQPTNTQSMSVAGSASYNHVRFANVPGLRYTFLLTADTTLRDNRLFGDVYGQVDRARYSVDNRLDYRIGMLDTRLSFTVNDVGGKKNALLFLQVNRQFGSY